MLVIFENKQENQVYALPCDYLGIDLEKGSVGVYDERGDVLYLTAEMTDFIKVRPEQGGDTDDQESEAD